MSTPTLEIRWFARGPVPAPVVTWADAAGLAPAEPRTDRYLVASTDALGLKVRDGRVEAKGRTAQAGNLQAGRAEARVQGWHKWVFWLEPAVPPVTDGWVDVHKRRRLRRDAGPDGGACTLELTEVEVGGQAWWTVGLEATGPTDAVCRAALDASAERWLARADAPALRPEDAAGYPAWLRRTAPDDTASDTA